MTTLNAELYDALKAAKMPEDKARAAATMNIEKMAIRVNMITWIIGIAFPLLFYVTWDTRNDIREIVKEEVRITINQAIDEKVLPEIQQQTEKAVTEAVREALNSVPQK